MAQRAREFARRLQATCDVRIAYRSPQKLRAILDFLRFLRRERPAVSYVFDMSYSGVLGACLYKLASGNRMVIDTGDAIYELARASGMRGRFGLWLTWLLEEFSLRAADRIVVRGTFHQRHLAARGIAAEVIQDGVDTAQFRPRDVSALRPRLGLDGVLTVGLVGSSVWNERQQMCYGWELVELVRLLRDKAVVGILIGNGSGIERLRARCREYGIEDRIQFWGYVPYDQLAERLCLIDVCLSTQTNDLAGQVRTTGKLPLYLAAGRRVMASDVGEAALALPPEMRVPYDGVKDESYPQRLAERIEELLIEPGEPQSRKAIAIAQTHFEYSMLAERLRAIIEDQSRSRQAVSQIKKVWVKG